ADGSASACFTNASPFSRYAAHVSLLNVPTFSAFELFGSCRIVRYFFVNFSRGSDKSVYAHIASGLVTSRFCGCVPRGGNPETTIPPCAIIVRTQGENSSA